MRTALRWALAAALALSPVKLLAADVALVVSNLTGSGFAESAKIGRELQTLIKAYRDDGFDVEHLHDSNSILSAAQVRTFETNSRKADRVIIHFIGRVGSAGDHRVMMANGTATNALVSAYRTGFPVALAYDLLKHRPARSALVISSQHGSDLAHDLELTGDIPNGLLVLTGEPLKTLWAVRDHLLKGNASGVRLAAWPELEAAGFVSDLALERAGAAPTATTATQTETQADAAIIEMRAWRQATQNGSREALQAYLDRYPNGLFRGEAQARLNSLAPAKSLEQTIEENLALSRSDRRKIQRDLTTLGFNTRGVDGLFGRGSRSAIERWQRAEGFRATGFLDAAQIRVLDQKARVKQEQDKANRERDDLAYWQQTGSGTNERGLRDYLSRYPEGLFSTQAKQALSRIEQTNSVQQNQTFIQRENALNMTGQTRALVEQRLTGLGYNVGPVDGNFTNETRLAIRDFQQKAGISPTGYMDNPTVTKLVASIFR